MKITKYTDFLFEHKLWYKTISQFLNWIKEKSETKKFIFLDTETTGLGGPKKTQLTQISAICTEYNFDTNAFKEISNFNQKIKLTEETKVDKFKEGSRINKVLSFNHYGDGDFEYVDEETVLSNFYDWVDQQGESMLVIQNASFDMNMINVRSKNIRFDNEILDTKQVIQLYYIPIIQKLSETDDYYKSLIDKIGTSDRDYGLISSSMSKIGPALKLSMVGYHDALTDCHITTEMLTKIIYILKDNITLDIIKYQLERIKTIKSVK